METDPGATEGLPEGRAGAAARPWLEGAMAAGLLSLALVVVGADREGWRATAWAALSAFVFLRAGLPFFAGIVRGGDRASDALAALGAAAAFAHGLQALPGAKGGLPLAASSAALAMLCLGRFLEERFARREAGNPAEGAGRIAIAIAAVAAAAGALAAWTLWGGHAGSAAASAIAAGVLLAACPRALGTPGSLRPLRTILALLYHAAAVPLACAGLCPPAGAALLSSLARLA
ncbi:MAG: hypothetical protein AAB215_02130, partial [Planctomycetota bacterium]